MSITPLPEEISQRYLHVQLFIDVMFIDEIQFFITLSAKLRFSTVKALPNRQKATYLETLKEVKSIYNQRGFRLVECHADYEFDCRKADIQDCGMAPMIKAEEEHVHEIERCIRVVKERTRGRWNTLIFKAMPDVLTKGMVRNTIYWLNAFPVSNGVSRTYSPSRIVTGRTPIDFNKDCQLECGQYVQTHESHDNTMRNP